MTATTVALPLGAVVVNEAGERAQVTWSNGRGVDGHYRLFDTDSYVLRVGAGVYRIGDRVGEWAPIPDVEWTVEERVRHAARGRRRRPTRRGGTTSPPPDSFAFALLQALLPPSENDRVFGDASWPVDVGDLAFAVARWLDHALPAQRRLGAALGGLR